MKVLGIGANGREHAYADRIAQSPRVTDMVWTPSNAGIPREIVRTTGKPIRCYDVKADDIDGIIGIADKEKPDLIVVGPEDPYAKGVVNRCRALGYPIWGPTQEEARFESSKVWAHEFAMEFGVPFAPGKACRSPEEALEYAQSQNWRCAAKISKLYLGKGVTLCRDEAAARGAIEAGFKADSEMLLQELLPGEELSLHFFLDGKVARRFPSSLDHKGQYEGNKGLNTGGLGTVSPHPSLSEAECEKIGQSVIKPFMKGCAARRLAPNGILYPGLMLTPSGALVLEFNFRGGGTETETYMTRLETDFIDIIEASMTGTLAQQEIVWKPITTVCVVMASVGYPGPYSKGKVIRGLDEVAKMKNVKVFHAGTKQVGEDVVTDGGRVLSVTASGEPDETLQDVRRRAYAAVDSIKFEGGAHVRRDIGGDPL